MVIKDERNFFTINEYYKYKKIDFDFNTVKRKKSSETWEEFVKRSLEIFLCFLKNIQPIINGKWEDIERDWMGYK